MYIILFVIKVYIRRIYISIRAAPFLSLILFGIILGLLVYGERPLFNITENQFKILVAACLSSFITGMFGNKTINNNILILFKTNIKYSLFVYLNILFYSFKKILPILIVALSYYLNYIDISLNSIVVFKVALNLTIFNALFALLDFILHNRVKLVIRALISVMLLTLFLYDLYGCTPMVSNCIMLVLSSAFVKYLPIKNNNIKVSRKFKLNIDPRITSTLIDFMTSSVMQIWLIIYLSFSFIVYTVFSLNINIGTTRYIIIITYIYISIGGSLLIDSIPSVNWKFYSIVGSPRTYHYARSILYQMVVLSPIYFFQFLISLKFDFKLLYYNILIDVLLLLSSTFISFWYTNMVFKAMLVLFICFCIVSVGLLNVLFLFLIIPILFLIFKKSSSDIFIWSIL